MGEKTWRAELAFCILKFHGEFHKYRLKECGWKPLESWGKGLLLESRETIKAFGSPLVLNRHRLEAGGAEN